MELLKEVLPHIITIAVTLVMAMLGVAFYAGGPVKQIDTIVPQIEIIRSEVASLERDSARQSQILSDVREQQRQLSEDIQSRNRKEVEDLRRQLDVYRQMPSR